MSNPELSSPKTQGGDEAACTRRRFLQAAAAATALPASASALRAASAHESGSEQRHLFWGDLHTHTDLSDGNGDPEANFEIARSHLDFWAMADHAYDEVVFSRDYRKDAPGRRILNDHWADVQKLCRAHEAPGRFVPFLAYEWTNFRYGHHNVYYLDYDQPIRMPPTLPELYAALSDVDALVIPHHPGYPVGICGKDWDFHDERLSPFVEVYSLHGSSEEPAGIRPLLTSGSWMGPGSSGGSVQEGLARGHKLGIIASSDSHADHPGAYDLGLIAAYANDLSRGSLWEAFHKRRVYAVTGDRIALDFSVNGQPMGSTVRQAAKRVLRVSAVAWDKVDRVEILKNNALVHVFADPVGASKAQGKTRIRFMIEWGWDTRAERDWNGSLKLTEGRILQAVPCFRRNVAGRLGRGIATLEDSQCQWTSRTARADYRAPVRRAADGVAFEVECTEKTRLQFRLACGGFQRDLTLSPADLLGKSTVKYMEEIPPTNDGAYWHRMETYAKFKVHQGWLTDQLTLSLTFEDDASENPRGRTDFYYVRLVQRNGQRAWSSPVWVEG